LENRSSLWEVNKDLGKDKTDLNDSSETQKRSDAVHQSSNNGQPSDEDEVEDHLKNKFSSSSRRGGIRERMYNKDQKLSKTVNKKSTKTFKMYLQEEGYEMDKHDSDAETIDEQSFSKLDPDLQKEVAKIMAKLKKSRRKRKIAKEEAHMKLEHLKEFYQNAISFKNDMIGKIDNASEEFRLYKNEVS
jgi:membrane peptidoglycan carboxypeptidase